jgi:uncharacterized phage protein gp47/JayE
MAITTQDFTTLVKNQVAAIQGAASTLVDLTVGSILRSLVEANAFIVLWLQGLILQVIARARAATSTDDDLDSWMADFGVTRLAASAATGLVSFARFTNTQQATIPVGTSVQTSDGTQKYLVYADTTNPAYSSSLSAYIIAAGVSSINVPVQAVTAGTGANALAAQINTLTSSIPGVDTVSNPSAFTNGVDEETDAALRVRFQNYIAGLSKATKAAVGYAVSSVQQGLSYTLTENYQYGGTAQQGYFYVVVDDGTGSPTSTLLSSVANAIDATRAVTIPYGVFAPVVTNAVVALTATIASGYDATATKLLVKNAITAYVNSLTIGQTLSYSRLMQVAYDASAGVTNITAYTLNGGAADITADSKHVIKASGVTVN